MVRSKMVSLLTVSVIMCILAAAAVVPAVALDSSRMAGDRSGYTDSYGNEKYDGDKCCDRCGDRCGGMDKDRLGYGGMHKAPKDIYMAVSGGSMSDGTATFNVDSIGMAGGKKGLAATVTFASPLTGKYNTTNDMGYISTANAIPMTIVVDKTGSAAMPAGNASAIIGLHGVKTMSKEDGYKVSEFKSISVFLPDGTVKYFKLDKPVKMTHSMDRKMVVIDAYPSFTKRMGEIFVGAGGASYSAMGMSTMSINDLKSMEARATPETIGYEEPAYVPPPA